MSETKNDLIVILSGTQWVSRSPERSEGEVSHEILRAAQNDSFSYFRSLV